VRKLSPPNCKPAGQCPVIAAMIKSWPNLGRDEAGERLRAADSAKAERGRPGRARARTAGGGRRAAGGPRLSADDPAGQGTGGWGGRWVQRFVCDFGGSGTRNRRQRRFPTRGRPGAAGHESWLRHSGTARTRSYGMAAAFMLLPVQRRLASGPRPRGTSQ
jgi:hypothetical protein